MYHRIRNASSLLNNEFIPYWLINLFHIDYWIHSILTSEFIQNSEVFEAWFSWEFDGIMNEFIIQEWMNALFGNEGIHDLIMDEFVIQQWSNEVLIILSNLNKVFIVLLLKYSLFYYWSIHYWSIHYSIEPSQTPARPSSFYECTMILLFYRQF